MTYVVYLVFDNLDFAAGAAPGSIVFEATPWIVLATFLLGLAVALAVRVRDPARYARIGRIVMAASHERAAPAAAAGGAIAVPTQPAAEQATPNAPRPEARRLRGTPRPPDATVARNTGPSPRHTPARTSGPPPREAGRGRRRRLDQGAGRAADPSPGPPS
ncbi:hypothetical protein [Frankia sp. QA3]|uniref:hypothetical protein n=1 Tax=Frankia sp. QA3 TaxID=710111 RepID=UPI0002F6C749|nr:hypothetical protein [Frankia sp. QA3]